MKRLRSSSSTIAQLRVYVTWSITSVLPALSVASRPKSHPSGVPSRVLPATLPDVLDGFVYAPCCTSSSLVDARLQCKLNVHIFCVFIRAMYCSVKKTLLAQLGCVFEVIRCKKALQVLHELVDDALRGLRSMAWPRNALIRDEWGCGPFSPRSA